MLKFSLAAALSALVIAAGSAPVGAVTRLSQTFDNWRVDCVTDAKNNKTCAMAFSLINQKSKQVVFAFSIRGPSGNDKAKIIVRTVNGVLLASGIEIVFPGTDPIKVTYRTCGPRACISEFDLTDNWLNTLSSKEKLTVGYSLVTSEPIKHEIPLKSFRPAYDFMTAQLEKQD